MVRVRRPSPDDLYPYYHQRRRVRIGGGGRGVLVCLPELVVLGDLENLDDTIVSNIASFLPKEDYNKLCSLSKKVKDMCNHTRGQRKLDIVPTYDMSRIPDRIVKSLQHIEVHKRMAVGEITMNLLLGSYPYFNDPPDETTIDLVQAAFNTGLNTAGSAFEEATKLTIDGNEEWTLEFHAPLRCIAQTTSLCCRTLTQFTLKGAGSGVTNDFIKLVVDNCPGLKKLEISKCGYATIEGSGNALQNGTNLKEVILEDVLIDIPYPNPMMRIANLEEERFKDNRLFPLLPASVERLSLNGCGRWISGGRAQFWRKLHQDLIMQFILLNPSLRWFRGNLREGERAEFCHKYPKLNNPGSTELDLTPLNSIYPVGSNII